MDMNLRWRLTVVLLGVAMLSAPAVAAKIRQSQDDQGTVHITNPGEAKPGKPGIGTEPGLPRTPDSQKSSPVATSPPQAPAAEYVTPPPPEATAPPAPVTSPPSQAAAPPEPVTLPPAKVAASPAESQAEAPPATQAYQNPARPHGRSSEVGGSRGRR